jgi:hypothetical protein
VEINNSTYEPCLEDLLLGHKLEFMNNSIDYFKVNIFDMDLIRY